MKTRRWLRNGFLGLVTFSAFLGVLLNLLDSNHPFQTLAYFTLQSNILVFFSFGYLLLKKGNLTDKGVIWKGAVTLAIIVTFLIYHILLEPFINPDVYSPHFLNNFLVHTLTPLLVVLDYALFQKKGRIHYRDIWYWMIPPYAYFVFVNLYALSGGVYTYDNGSTSRYPYFFINPDSIGWGHVLLYVLAITAFFAALSLLIAWIDRVFGKGGVSHAKTKKA